MVFRRFVPIGTNEEMDRFMALVKEKNLSREELITILRAIKLSPKLTKEDDPEDIPLF